MLQQPDPSPNAGEAGYFLTDAVVGLFVLASVTGSLMGAFGLAHTSANRADHTAKALIVAKACIEERGVDLERVFTIAGTDYRETRSIERLETEAGNVAPLVRTRCTAQWTEKGLAREVELERIDWIEPST